MSLSLHECHVCAQEDPTNTRKPRPVVNSRRPLWCATHRREEDRRQTKVHRATQIEKTYGISAEDNHALFMLQGGKCWLCRKATGATKSLAVDHDHKTDEVRGRLCGPCNQFIGRLGDDPQPAQRLVAYLTGDTPYRRLKAAQALAQAASNSYLTSNQPINVLRTWSPMVGQVRCEWSYSDRPNTRYENLVFTHGQWGYVRDIVQVMTVSP